MCGVWRRLHSFEEATPPQESPYYVIENNDFRYELSPFYHSLINFMREQSVWVKRENPAC